VDRPEKTHTNMKLIALLCLLPLTLTVPALNKRAGPTVITLAPQATVIGKTLLKVNTFNDIPYAQPPVG
jgi:hypothetical protein